jgi:hypothetical protein
MQTFFLFVFTSSNTERQVALNFETDRVSMVFSPFLPIVKLLWSFYGFYSNLSMMQKRPAPVLTEGMLTERAMRRVQGWLV